MVRAFSLLRRLLPAVLLLSAIPVLAQSPAGVSGKWAFEVVTENGTGTPAVVLKQEGEKLTGTYESARSGLRQIEGTVKGDKITFTVKASSSGGVDLNFSGTIIGDTITGTADFSGQGSATFSAKRAPA